jgi:separase
LECFSALPADCRDEELEDLVYFILDLYQSHGIPVDVAEVDVTVLVVELRMVFEEHAAKYQASILPVEDSHIFLVLDKNIQGLPWESIPIFRGRSVSRIPSIDFLMDRLDLETVRHSVENPDRVKIDAKKTFYCLNPSGDLKGTEGRFAPWLKKMEAVGWTGVIGRPPAERQMLDALEKNDLVM